MTKTTIRFEEPPARSSNPQDTNAAEIVEQLKQNPREWGIIREAGTRLAAYAMAYQIRTGRLVPYRPAGAFEAKGRTVDGTFRVYARYVGEDGDDA